MLGIVPSMLVDERRSTVICHRIDQPSVLSRKAISILIGGMSLYLVSSMDTQAQIVTASAPSHEIHTQTHLIGAPSFVKMLAQAKSQAPKLLEQAANTRAAQADARQASTWLNPTFNATAENIGASPSGGQSQRQDTFAVTQFIEIGGKRTARIEAELGKSTLAQVRERHIYLLFASELAMAYATAEAMQQRKDVANAELIRANDDLRATQALVKAGRETELRVMQAQASVAASRASAQAATADATEALERLAALVGVKEAYTHITHPFLSTITPLASGGNWNAENSLNLSSALTERAAMEAQVRLEEKRWIPDLGVTVGVRKFGWNNDNAKTIGITANIPLFDRNQSGINAAKERANSAAMRVETARLEATANHRSAIAQFAASEARLQASEQSEAAAIEAYRLGRIGYDAGKTTLPELLAIRRASSEAKALVIDARLARVRALIALSVAEGRLVFTVSGETP